MSKLQGGPPAHKSPCRTSNYLDCFLFLWVIQITKINADPDPKHCVSSISRGCFAHLRAGVKVTVVWREVGGPVEPGGEPAAKVRQLLVHAHQHLALHHPLKVLAIQHVANIAYHP
jgi:hypothetical protein